eukprot:CAMPEP_0114500374 /NCGR_PEP_ID=MMETSP0109-20121206/7928_1 /TAXON_ID=29199 /ORGANISM="Chlorarachnion reptans, Strain CCCM449" /LENGTH=276 /DNA_ID=CAMNT_0001678027 /DNA_START=61 /DNA_END=891 /DNA_ORIENTATION=-
MASKPIKIRQGKPPIAQRRREAEQILATAVKNGKTDLLEKDSATNWRSSPPMPPSTIKMVLWDMDRTLLNTHTRGLWTEDISKLAKEVTRAFKILVPHLLHKNFAVGVVTFSDKLVLSSNSRAGDLGMAGEDLVNDLLEETFTELYLRVKKLKSNKDLAMKNAKHIRKQIFVAAAFPELRNQHDSDFKDKEMPNSKRWHIDQVIQQYKEKTGSVLKYDEIMLFDDTIENVEAALSAGVHAFAVSPQSAFTSSCWELALETLQSPNDIISKLRKRAP